MSFLRLFELPQKEVKVFLLATGIIVSSTVVYKKIKKKHQNDNEEKKR